MKNIKNQLSIFVRLFTIALISLPQTSSAYETTKQSALQINENTILYTITYRFGFLNREVYLPIGAMRGLANASTSPYVGFDILNNGTSTTQGKVGALVLSTAEIKNNHYYLPEGKSGDFTLVALMTLPQGNSLNKHDLNLKMNHLPFIMAQKGEAGRTYLNEREMEPYISPKVK